MSCRCAPKATAGGIGCPTPRTSRTGTSSLSARCLATDGGGQDEVPLRPEGDGRRYWPPRITQTPRVDFFVAGEMPGDGQGAAR